MSEDKIKYELAWASLCSNIQKMAEEMFKMKMKLFKLNYGVQTITIKAKNQKDAERFCDRYFPGTKKDQLFRRS